MAFVGQNKLLEITTALGKDKFLLRLLSGEERMSGLFSFQLELASEDAKIDFSKIIGTNATVSVQLVDGNERYFNGIISRFSMVGQDDRFKLYRAVLVPQLWLLTRRADCQIFQDLTIPDIIEKVFSDAGLTDYELSLSGNYDKWDYCVQYRETHFNFVSRLMEQYGIFYYFRHENGKHVLVLGDSPAAHQVCPHQASASIESMQQVLGAHDVVTGWQVEQVLHFGRFAHTDYDFKNPSTSLTASLDTVTHIGGNDAFEIFDYPGEYELKAVGDDIAKLRMEEEEADHVTYSGQTTCRAFSPGFSFKLKGHRESPEFNKSYVMTSTRHHASNGSLVSGTEDSAHYGNDVVCIDANVPYRPRRTTPKPIVQGMQTAVVVGPSGEEIYTDKYGRVKVHFFWDRKGKRDEKSSCWIRVAQPIAGKRWGTTFLPRLGQEVIVSFLEGDPDQPLITSSVYNAEQMPPYLGEGLDGKHPNNFSISGYKSNSTKGGSGYNEWRFNDTAGKEQLFLHAERDMDTRVKHDSIEHVGADRHFNVAGNRTEAVGKEMILNVGADYHSIVGASRAESVAADHDFDVGGDQTTSVTGGITANIGKDLDETIGGAWAVSSGKTISIKAGMKLVIQAGAQISLVGPGGFVDIGPSGVTIQGTMVMINSGGSAGSPVAPKSKKPKKPKNTKPKVADESKSGKKSK